MKARRPKFSALTSAKLKIWIKDAGLKDYLKEKGYLYKYT